MKILRDFFKSSGEKTSQELMSGDNSVIVQAGRDAIIGINKCPPDVRLVRLEILPDTKIGTRQDINVVLKNNGDKTAVITKGSLIVSGSEEYVDCNDINSRHSLIVSDWTYDVDISQPTPQFIGRHSIAPNEVVSFNIMVGRKKGSHILKIYRCALLIEFDEGEPLETENFYLEISGPTQIMGLFTPGVSAREWGTCMADNIRRLDELGYDIRDSIDSRSAHLIETVSPGILSKKINK